MSFQNWLRKKVNFFGKPLRRHQILVGFIGSIIVAGTLYWVIQKRVAVGYHSDALLISLTYVLEPLLWVFVGGTLIVGIKRYLKRKRRRR